MHAYLHTHNHTLAHKHTPWHTQAHQGSGTEEKVLEKDKYFLRKVWKKWQRMCDDRSEHLTPCCCSLVQERALTTRPCAKEWYAEHMGVCRRMEVPRGSIKVKKARGGGGGQNHSEIQSKVKRVWNRSKVSMISILAKMFCVSACVSIKTFIVNLLCVFIFVPNGSVQFSPLTDWVVVRGGGAIQQRSGSVVLSVVGNLVSKAWIPFFSESASRVYVSQQYRRMEMTI